MKSTLLLCLLFCVPVFAANPTFQSFDTNNFTANAAINFITANTSPLNPSALVNQAQLAGVLGPTNGVTAATATNIADFRFSQDIIPLSLAPSLVEQLNTTNHTLSQRFNLYNTFTDSSNYRRLSLYYSGADAVVDANAAGTGLSSGNLIFQIPQNHAIRFAFTSVNYYNFDTNRFAPFPAFDNLLDLGGTDRRWKNFYVGSTNFSSYFSGTGLNLSGAAKVDTLTATNGMFALDIPQDSLVITDGDQKLNHVTGGVGVLTNDNAGSFGFTTSVPSSWVNGLPPRTNYVAFTNAATVGQFLVVVGRDEFGSVLVVATNISTTIPTNTMGGTAIDFANEEATTNLAGDLILTSVANLTLGVYNHKLMHVINKTGSDHTVTVATGWGVGIADTFTVTNNTRMNLWGECQPGVFTNVFQKQIVTH